MAADVHLDIRGIGKSFGATRALDDVSIAITRGSVHALVGENGAGKSTLGKIVAGVFPQDQGDLVLGGDTVTFRSPRKALERGIALVAQEVALVPRASVADNVLLGNEPRRGPFVDRAGLVRRVTQLAGEAGFDLDPMTPVGTLPLAKQQQVEILRAIARDAGLIILDEPSASLSAAEVTRLHDLVRALAAAGRTVILVSHFLPEVLALADTVTVLRDGRVVRTGPATAETEATLIAGMLGRSIGRTYPEQAPPAADAPVALDVQQLSAPGVTDVSLHVRTGEIVALAGLVGAGRSELVRALYGAAERHGGTATLADAPLPDSPRASLGAGMAFIPESRKDDGLMLHRPVRENVSLTRLATLSRFGILRRGKERTAVSGILGRVSGTDRLDEPADALSGGNQQKLLFARALLATPGLLIADEPTRGVDIGAKRDLYELLVDIAARGTAVLLVSNEIEEVLGLAHRIYVMRAGTIVAELRGDQRTEEAILTAAFGQAAAA